MGTTINVDAQLLMQAKAQAATLGVTLAHLIEDALRASLMRREHVEHRGRVRLITMQGTGTRPGIDLDKQSLAPGDHGAMILMDVNILVYAHREETTGHLASRNWGEETINSGGAYGVSELVRSGFMRVVTHPQVFARPTPLVVALEVVKQIRDQPQAVPIRPGPRHWAIFEKLLRASEAKGNLVPDAYHAALAIESGCDWSTTDKGFLRCAGWRARHPLRKAL